jgi:hypothetical protein
MDLDAQNEKNIELDILLKMLHCYHLLPLDFCLKEFLNWEDAKIKTFNKERRKMKKYNQKKSIKISNSISETCCTDNKYQN